MNKIKTLIVDDERNNSDYLRLLLQENCSCIDLIGISDHPLKAIELIKQMQPQLVFLDIEMPSMTGFDVLQELEPIHFEVVFVTAHNHYALHAFDVHAIGYLTKPVEKAKLVQTVLNAKERIEQKSIQQHLFSLLQQQEISGKSPIKLALPTQNGLQFIKHEDILHCDSNGNYTWFYLKDDTKILVSRQLGEYEKLLPPDQFVRIHDKHIINLSSLSTYLRGSGGEVRLENGRQLPVSAKRKEDLLQRFERWVKRG
jgi:two-component system LytT family response regulator